MRIAVYCGSHCGADPAFEAAARELGAWIGRSGHTLVYGAGFTGIMGAVSEEVQAGGGYIIGVIPQFMAERNWQKSELRPIRPEEIPAAGEERIAEEVGILLVTDSMSTRKSKMLELADVYVALPGGPGTFEEITEAISLSCVGQHEKECILLNINGYYEPLRRMYEDAVAQGYTERGILRHMHYAADMADLLGILERSVPAE